MNNKKEKRLFFGFEVEAPWPSDFPDAHLLNPVHRHLTLAFLGQTETQKVYDFLGEMPKPPLSIGHAGIFDSCLFLPPNTPRVIAYHVQPLGTQAPLFNYQKKLTHFLQEKGYHFAKQEFLPHVTVGRLPFDRLKWEAYFFPLPMVYTSLHLYESLGSSHYRSLWNFPLLRPFVEIEHIADIAFHVYGETCMHLHLNAQIALCFEYPPLVKYLQLDALKDRVEEMVIQLNDMLTKADQAIGTPFKAVSFHGEIHKNSASLFEWEMIIDV